MHGEGLPHSHRRARDTARRARLKDEVSPIPFVDTEAAARYLALEAQTLMAYRALVSGPFAHKFGKRVRYAVGDLDAWARSRRRVTASGPTRTVPSPPISQRHWPAPDILRRARFVYDAGPIRFVDTEAAARHLALETHTLECNRSLGGGPAYHKFGKWVRYAINDLDAWAAGRPTPAIKSSLTPHRSAAARPRRSDARFGPPFWPMGRERCLRASLIAHRPHFCV
jgi:Helix-turn-helix domain